MAVLYTEQLFDFGTTVTLGITQKKPPKTITLIVRVVKVTLDERVSLMHLLRMKQACIADRNNDNDSQLHLQAIEH